MRSTRCASVGSALAVVFALSMPSRPLCAERLFATPVPAPQAAPAAATPEITLEAEEGEYAAAKVMTRSAASGLQTLWLHGGESVTMAFKAPEAGRYGVSVHYSNYKAKPCDRIPCPIVPLYFEVSAL